MSVQTPQEATVTDTPFRGQPDGCPPLRDPFFRELAGDWARVCSMTSTWTRLLRRWAKSQPTLKGISSPDEILERIDHGAAADKDQILLALITLTQQGQQLAGRVVLQAMLPKLAKMASRTRPTSSDRSEPLDERRHATIATFWEILSTYPVQRRPHRVAANLALDTLHEVTKPTRDPVTEIAVPDDEMEWRNRHRNVDLATSVDGLTSESDLLEVLAWAVDVYAITHDEARLLVTVYVPARGRLDYAAAAEELGLTAVALRQRCSRARRRLVDAVRADACDRTLDSGPGRTTPARRVGARG